MALKATSHSSQVIIDINGMAPKYFFALVAFGLVLVPWHLVASSGVWILPFVDKQLVFK